MPEITDPMNALESLQVELRNVSIQPCELDPSLSLITDHPNGQLRLSYAKIDNGIVKSLAIFASSDPIDGVTCFNLGYAVAKDFRNQGLASAIVEAAISELQHGLGRNGVPRFYVEGIVSVNNIASQKVAERVLSKEAEAVVDEYSGEDAYHYTRLVECGLLPSKVSNEIDT